MARLAPGSASAQRSRSVFSTGGEDRNKVYKKVSYRKQIARGDINSSDNSFTTDLIQIYYTVNFVLAHVFVVDRVKKFSHPVRLPLFVVSRAVCAQVGLKNSRSACSGCCRAIRIHRNVHRHGHLDICLLTQVAAYCYFRAYSGIHDE